MLSLECTMCVVGVSLSQPLEVSMIFRWRFVTEKKFFCQICWSFLFDGVTQCLHSGVIEFTSDRKFV
jgi:hypothetical protein